MKLKNKFHDLLIIMIALCSMQGAFAFNNETWKVLVYMQADNNLSSYTYWDLAEMEAAITNDSNSNVDVFVELDLPGDEGSFRLAVKPGKKNISNNVEDYNNYRLDDLSSEVISISSEYQPQAERLLNFIIWSQKEKPTDNTLLVIWGHGEGWSNGLAQFGGVALDTNPETRLSIREIKQVLSIQSEITNSKVDFLSMDACLMQTIEVAYEFAGTVEYVSGSTQMQNFRGLPYTRLINYLEREDNSAYQLAKDLSQLYSEELANYASVEDLRLATISVVNTSELANEFIYQFNHALAELRSALKETPLELIKLKQLLKNMPSFLGNSRDLMALIGVIQKFLAENNNTHLYLSFNKVLKSLNQSVVSYGYGDFYVLSRDYNLGYFKSFGIWFPASSTDYKNRKSDFQSSRLFRTLPQWSGFLDDLFNQKVLNFNLSL